MKSIDAYPLCGEEYYHLLTNINRVSLHRLVPLKDSLQRFEMNVKGALRCLTDLLSNDQDMVVLGVFGVGLFLVNKTGYACDELDVLLNEVAPC